MKPTPLHIQLFQDAVLIQLPPFPMDSVLPPDVMQLTADLEIDVLGMALVHMASEFHKRHLKATK